jgi:riboflavin kinase/FMN adenylyltransferase
MTFVTPARELDRVVGAHAGTIISGVVETGDQRGRTLGFPTANLALDGHRANVPADGVWAGWLRRESGTTHVAAISIGRRPTFYGREGIRLLEAHVLDFDGDLYGSLIEVGLCLRIRGQQAFESVGALVEQLHRDVSETRRWAAHVAGSPTPSATGSEDYTSRRSGSFER